LEELEFERELEQGRGLELERELGRGLGLERELVVPPAVGLLVEPVGTMQPLVELLVVVLPAKELTEPQLLPEA
jgi:hypothetical protein